MSPRGPLLTSSALASRCCPCGLVLWTRADAVGSCSCAWVRLGPISTKPFLACLASHRRYMPTSLSASLTQQSGLADSRLDGGGVSIRTTSLSCRTQPKDRRHSRAAPSLCAPGPVSRITVWTSPLPEDRQNGWVRSTASARVFHSRRGFDHLRRH